MFERLLERLAEALDSAGLPYMVIGGQAVLVYGEPRLTKDIDITVGVDDPELSRVLAVVSELGLEILVENVERFVADTKVLPVKDAASDIRVDIIFSNSTYERQAIEHCRAIEMRGTAVKFATPEDIVIHKIIAGRGIDLEDARKIVLKNPTLDKQYIIDWLEKFDEALAGDFRQGFGDILESTSK